MVIVGNEGALIHFLENPATIAEVLLDGLAQGKSFAGARLTSTSFDGLNLTGINLSGAWLQGSTFAGTNLTGAILDGAQLQGVDFSNAILVDVGLSDALLYGVRSDGATVSGTTDASEAERNSVSGPLGV